MRELVRVGMFGWVLAGCSDGKTAETSVETAEASVETAETSVEILGMPMLCHSVKSARGAGWSTYCDLTPSDESRMDPLREALSVSRTPPSNSIGSEVVA